MADYKDWESRYVRDVTSEKYKTGEKSQKRKAQEK